MQFGQGTPGTQGCPQHHSLPSTFRRQLAHWLGLTQTLQPPRALLATQAPPRLTQSQGSAKPSCPPPRFVLSLQHAQSLQVRQQLRQHACSKWLCPERFTACTDQQGKGKRSREESNWLQADHAALPVLLPGLMCSFTATSVGAVEVGATPLKHLRTSTASGHQHKEMPA